MPAGDIRGAAAPQRGPSTSSQRSGDMLGVGRRVDEIRRDVEERGEAALVGDAMLALRRRTSETEAGREGGATSGGASSVPVT